MRKLVIQGQISESGCLNKSELATQIHNHNQVLVEEITTYKELKKLHRSLIGYWRKKSQHIENRIYIYIYVYASHLTHTNACQKIKEI